MKIFITGGAGFVGQSIARRLEYEGHSYRIFDRVLPLIGSGVCGDIHDMELLTQYMAGSDLVFHLASNADISASEKDPTMDFREGTELTQNVLEAMRLTGVKKLVYFSGSGVYGDYPTKIFHEDHGPLLPISTYGASKLASEALIHAYCSMFGLEAIVFRPANIVGSGQTHGVVYDFVRRLKADPSHLRVLGDGQQTKSYIHISDVLDAVWLAMQNWESPYEVYNVAAEDYITVKEIATMTAGSGCQIEYIGGDRGWNGDVPRINFDCTKLHQLGWKPKLTSAQAIQDSINSML